MDITGGINAGTAGVKESAFISYVEVLSPNQWWPWNQYQLQCRLFSHCFELQI